MPTTVRATRPGTRRTCEVIQLGALPYCIGPLGSGGTAVAGPTRRRHSEVVGAVPAPSPDCNPPRPTQPLQMARLAATLLAALALGALRAAHAACDAAAPLSAPTALRARTVTSDKIQFEWAAPAEAVKAPKGSKRACVDAFSFFISAAGVQAAAVRVAPPLLRDGPELPPRPPQTHDSTPARA